MEQGNQLDKVGVQQELMLRITLQEKIFSDSDSEVHIKRG